MPSVFFVLLGSALIKAAHKILMKLSPEEVSRCQYSIKMEPNKEFKKEKKFFIKRVTS